MTDHQRSLKDAMSAEVIGGTRTSLLVRYEDGYVDSVSKDSLHGAICNLEQIDPNHDVHASGDVLDLSIDMDRMVGEISAINQPGSVSITGSQLAEALLAVEEAMGGSGGQVQVYLTSEFENKLYDVYEEKLKNRVREDVIDQFSSRFRGVEVTENGWEIEDTYIITYEAENYLLDDIETYGVSGGDVHKTDGKKQAVGLKFDLDPYEEYTSNIDGEPTDFLLSETEQSFLATAEFLTRPKKYLDVGSFEREVYAAIRESKGDPIIRSMFEEMAANLRVTHFVDPKSGLVHRHDIDKHTLRATFQVKQWVVDELEYSSFDHAGLAELAWREDYFRNHDRPVFFDGAPNNSEEKWDEINRLERNAPCPPQVYQRLLSLYGSK